MLESTGILAVDVMSKKEWVIQFSKFAVVGVINTLVNLLVLSILTEFFGIYYMFSAVFAFLVAVTNSFVMNSLWTFNHKLNHKPAEKYSKFFVISICALGVNLALLYFFTEYMHIYYLFSQLIAVFFSLWVNFTGNKFWTFR